VGDVHCDEWFVRWQDAKKARRSRVRINNKRGGAESTAARDRVYWSKWWAPAIGSMLPRMVTQRDITSVIDAMAKAPSTTDDQDALVARADWFSNCSWEMAVVAQRWRE
jgi:hypothetical protein